MSSPERGSIYENAPVVEVIAEVLWELRSILGSNLAYDPFFDDLADTFGSYFKDKEKTFSYSERVVPSEVPQEILSHKPIFRYREVKEGWPLYQIGPGIFTANVVPPYEGWLTFFPVISEGLKALYAKYPLADRHLKPVTLRLVYINAFGRAHGYEKQQEDFIKEGLHFNIVPPAELSEYIEEGHTTIISEFNFKLRKLENSYATVKLGSGLRDGIPVLIVENVIYKNVVGLNLRTEQIETWFSDAHDKNHEIFEAYITDNTRKTFGKMV